MSIDTVRLTPGSIKPNDFMQFKQFLAARLSLSPAQEAVLVKTIPGKLYSLVEMLGLTDERLARYIAESLRLAYLPQVNPETILSGILPPSFCR